jgi:2-hydroxychromene-2-carboxylate isomerase
MRFARLPAGFPQHSLPAARAFYWIDGQAPEKAPEFAKSVYRRYWIDGLATADPDVAVDAAARLGFDTNRVREALNDAGVKQRVIAENERAIANGVFGSPFIMVEGEPFWGSDRLNAVADRLAGAPASLRGGPAC